MVDYNWMWPQTSFGADNPLGLVNPKGGGSDYLAMKLLRAQFENWMKNFMPLELQQMQELSFNNPDVLPKAIEEADRNVMGSFGGMEKAFGTINQSLGVEQTGTQQEGTRRLMGLDKALALAGAENKARAGVRAQDTAILYGSAPPNLNVQTV